MCGVASDCLRTHHTSIVHAPSLDAARATPSDGDGRSRTTTETYARAMTPADARAGTFDDVDALVFDCDGTLIDTMGMFYAADARACAERGIVLDRKTFYDLAGVPVREIFHRVCRAQGVAMDDDGLDAMTDACERYVEDFGTPDAIECVCDIVRRARARGKKLAVASSGTRSSVTRHLARRGLLDAFDVVVTVDDVASGRGKPAPDLYALAAARLGVDPGRCVAYEDAVLGMESARRAGYARVVDVRELSGYHAKAYPCAGPSEP